MIDLKDKPDLGWNLLFAASVVGVGAAVWFGFLAPVGLSASTTGSHLNEQQRTLTRATANAKDDMALISRDTWSAPVELVGSQVLDYVSDLSQKHSVQLTSFRTDKPVEVASLSEAPFVLVVEGGFSDVVSFMNALEDPKSKLAVNLVQISNTGTGTGRVTATFGLLGFLFKEPK